MATGCSSGPMALSSTASLPTTNPQAMARLFMQEVISSRGSGPMAWLVATANTCTETVLFRKANGCMISYMVLASSIGFIMDPGMRASISEE